MQLVSLSHVNDPATTTIYPGDPPFELETVATIERDGYYLRFVRQGEHTGTHWGAPGHFNQGEPLADELDLHDLHRPAVKIDVREKCARDPGYAVTVADVEAWEKRHGRIPDESMVIIWTGWDAKWGTAGFTRAHPGFAVETARWLIGTGRVGHRGGTGTDAFSPDVGADETFAVSRLIYQRHRISLEILANLQSLPETGAHILCGGQINRAGSGSPALIYGLLP
ncbi:cyclase family protein [Actinoplanes sp. LDG1-06]|uniref:Cyclase family protein n=1 Tax=Paractinoplanes ovalisporus TaxID=2810368 RepID=A0ABS2AT62_9ACTN|nr:cyclase family protein [Actinoplanes ovalisporus]MBM2623055.1 cyclase family protein [Actinoplanes ovalisporus]